MQLGNVRFRGDLHTQIIRPKKVGPGYKLKNLPNVWRGWWKWQIAKALRIPTFYGELRVKLIKANGEVIDYGLISTRVVTTAFVSFVVDQLQTETSVFGDFKFHDGGIGTTAENVADTGIETTDGEARATGTQTEQSATIYKSVGTVSYTTTKAVTEHGLFNDATAGTLMDRSVFAALNVVNGDSIQFDYRLTVAAGG